MGWVLVALLLLPAGVLTADRDFGMTQPKHLSAIVGDSIEIPFSFFHSWELPKDPKVKLFWRWIWFHGEFIYNMTPPFIHKHFKDRLVLNFTKNGNSGSLSILNLRKEDETMYFCRVHLKTKKMGEQRWQSIEGTQLTITEGKSLKTLRRNMKILPMKDNIQSPNRAPRLRALSMLSSPSPTPPHQECLPALLSMETPRRK
ncbi:paired immunoglobulin-like type 2 receptor alpha isoform X2 [Dipodomys merriami]|uniref:paired immunoglobulin-like type 2 receptor alpha isoform X2 n=1 Tax=Dipodomys merriami TaxID=94247 RepID=UPI0038559109